MSAVSMRQGPFAGHAPVTAVVAAMQEELAPLLARASDVRRLPTRPNRLPVWTAKLGQTPLMVARLGEGPVSAARGVDVLLEAFPVSRLIVLGIAGGLTPGLAAGTLVVAQGLRDSGAAVPAPDPGWAAQALRTLEAVPGGAVAGTVISSTRILCTAAEKADLGAILPGQMPAVVDLESAAIARAAARHQIPLLVLRAVCDTVDESFPFDLDGCRDGSGAVSRWRVAGKALARPGTLPALWQWRGRTLACARGLAGAVEGLLA